MTTDDDGTERVRAAGGAGRGVGSGAAVGGLADRAGGAVWRLDRPCPGDRAASIRCWRRSGSRSCGPRWTVLGTRPRRIENGLRSVSRKQRRRRGSRRSGRRGRRRSRSWSRGWACRPSSVTSSCVRRRRSGITETALLAAAREMELVEVTGYENGRPRRAPVTGRGTRARRAGPFGRASGILLSAWRLHDDRRRGNYRRPHRGSSIGSSGWCSRMRPRTWNCAFVTAPLSGAPSIGRSA